MRDHVYVAGIKHRPANIKRAAKTDIRDTSKEIYAIQKVVQYAIFKDVNRPFSGRPCNQCL